MCGSSRLQSSLSCRPGSSHRNRREVKAFRENAGATPEPSTSRAETERTSDPAPLDSDGWTQFLAGFLEGFPALQLKVEAAAADAEMVAQRILFTGTHTGVFQGLPPTDRQVSFSGIEINRMVGGKVAEHWFQLDQVTLLQQLGLRVLPGPRLLPRLLTHQAKKLLGRRPSTADS
jgi:predicted ester cyclase